MIDKIKKQLLEFRLAKDVNGAMALRTLLGEIENKRDQDPVAIVTKFIKNAELTLEQMQKLSEPKPEAEDVIRHEIALYKTYLPEQLTLEEVTSITEGLLAEGKNIGQIMKHFGENHKGRYDPRMVTSIINKK